LVKRENYLLACGRYVERNPLRACLVEGPLAYPWPGARDYSLGEDDGLTDVAFNGCYLSLAREPQ
jgi:putative transposase